MFRGSYQRKLLTILYSGGSNPLEIWDIQVKNGWTRRIKDDDMGTIVFEICGTNVATAYIVTPPDPRGALGISLPFITMFIKNLKRYFTFEIQILDDKQMRRRFRFSNYQSSTKVRPFTCSVPLALKPGWNQMQLNLANFTTRAYGTNYMETQRVQIHANCRIRRVYFSDRLYAEEELPKDYRIYLTTRQGPCPTEQPEKVTSMQSKPSRITAEKESETRSEQKETTILKKPSDATRSAHSELVAEMNLRTSSTSRHSRGSRSLHTVAEDKSMKISLPEDARTSVQSVHSKGSRKSVRSGTKIMDEEKRSMTAIAEEKEPAVEGEGEEQGEVEAAEMVEGIEGGAGEAPVEETQEIPEIPLEQTETESPVEPEGEIVDETPRAEEESPRTEDESPRSDMPESEVAESEPIPESDVEVTEPEPAEESPPPSPEPEEPQE